LAFIAEKKDFDLMIIFCEWFNFGVIYFNIVISILVLYNFIPIF
jgi:hypothetical protein